MTDFIEVHDGALDAGFCQDIINRFNQSPHVQRGRTGHGVDVAKKDSYDLCVNTTPGWEDVRPRLQEAALAPLKLYLRKYLFTLIGAPSPAIEDPTTGQKVTLTEENFAELGDPILQQIVGAYYRYGVLNVQKYLRNSGGYPHWHSEIYPQDQACEPLHRVLAFQFYLNDVTEGGETEFYYQKRKVESRAGRMVIFPAAFTHTHRGNVSKSGDKYIITSWVMFHRSEHIQSRRLT